jgi:hypothetical protein
MKLIKVSSGDEKFSRLLIRQTPGGKGVWKDCKFIVNEEVEVCDCWVVCHRSGLIKNEKTVCDPDNVIYMSMEGEEAIVEEGVRDKFLDQFSKVISCDRNINHNNVCYEQVNTWWVGNVVNHINGSGHKFFPEYRLDYDSLLKFRVPKKKTKISIIVSKKNSLNGHKKRLEFLDKLLESDLRSKIDVFVALAQFMATSQNK